MAGGIEWFRWYHGSVTDPKFGVVAKKSGSRVSDVIAVWAVILELASSKSDRGNIGQLDFEAIEHLLGIDDGQAERILDAMIQRGLLTGDGKISSWDKRQAKKEDDTATERKRRQRERDAELLQQNKEMSRDVTDMSRNVTQCHDREEKSREEKRTVNAVDKSTVATSLPPPTNPKEIIFKLGVSILTEQGEKEAQARSFLGRFAGKDEAKLAEVIGHLATHPKVQAKAYIAGAFKPEERGLVL